MPDLPEFADRRVPHTPSISKHNVNTSGSLASTFGPPRMASAPPSPVGLSHVVNGTITDTPHN